MPSRRLDRLLPAACLLVSLGAVAAEPEPLPQPLTLDYALSLAEAPHPALGRIRAALGEAEAGLRAADAGDAPELYLDGRVRWVEPSPKAADPSSGDHAVSLVASKNLFDFGRSRARVDAARRLVDAGEARLADTLGERRIAIMRRFFDVLLADLRFALANEAMAVDYVTLDRLRDRHGLGQVSDIELLEMESRYQETRQERAEAEAEQRARRARLALALGRPGELPADLVPPDLELERELPPYDDLLQAAMARNPRLRALRAELAAAEAALAGARAVARPTIDASAEVSEYARELGSSDRWRAGLNFRVPLYTGGRVDAAVADAEASVYAARARLSEAEYEVREAVLALWLELGTVGVRGDRVQALQDFRDLYLDRSRAVYEMEFKADLGDAMVRLTEAQRARLALEFDIALAWERLDLLIGGGASARPVAGESQS